MSKEAELIALAAVYQDGTTVRGKIPAPLVKALKAKVEAEGREQLRLLLQGHLDERAPGTTTAPVVDARNSIRTHPPRTAARWILSSAP